LTETHFTAPFNLSSDGATELHEKSLHAQSRVWLNQAIRRIYKGVQEGNMTFTKLELLTGVIAVCFVCFLLWGSGWLN